MENSVIGKVESLLDEFDKVKGFYEMVCDWFYTAVADSFKDEVEDSCKVVIFGDEYSMSVQELYDYDRCYAVDLWRDHITRFLEEDFPSWVELCIGVDIDEFTEEFQQWLASQDDERASDAIVALMIGDIDLTKIVVDWLCDRLGYEDWKYPTETN